MREIPERYLADFDPVFAHYGIEQRLALVSVRCRHCGQDLKPNALGMQSHITMHVREAEKKRKTK